MAEKQEQGTEEATPFKLREAQKRGSVAKSMDLARLAPRVVARELGRAARRRYAGRTIPAAEFPRERRKRRRVDGR